MPIQLKQLNSHDIPNLALLAEEAGTEGFDFVRRTVTEWQSGKNDFSGTGEFLLGAFCKGHCIAIGGLNTDPYLSDPAVGRLRHLYISPHHRRKGIASRLVEKIIQEAKTSFECLRLYTDNPEAAIFYERMGFAATGKEKESHFMKWK